MGPRKEGLREYGWILIRNIGFISFWFDLSHMGRDWKTNKIVRRMLELKGIRRLEEDTYFKSFVKVYFIWRRWGGKESNQQKRFVIRQIGKLEKEVE